MLIQELICKIKERKYNLERLKALLEKSIPSYPEGHLNVSPRSHPGKGYLYYLTDGHGNLTYIKKDSYSLAAQLAQKEYDIKLLRMVNAELSMIEHYLKLLSRGYPESLYPSLPPARRAAVTPFIYPDEEYICNWKAQPFTGRPFADNDPEHYTKKGLRVRSKSEELIANILDEMDIPYKYECPLTLKGWGKVYPDFTVLHVMRRKDVIWEHLGMMDDPEYATNAAKKISKYMANGYYPGENLILTFETSKAPVTTNQIAEICRHYFLGRPGQAV